MGYKDTWDRRIFWMIRGIQGYVGYEGYKDTWHTMICGYRGYNNMWDTRIHGTRGYMGYMGYEDAGYRDTRRQGYGDTP